MSRLTNFQDNLPRLLGLHNLSASFAARLVDISPVAFSAWRTGQRQPSLPTVFTLAEFFEVSSDGLMTKPFRELLTSELTDPDRFDRVEAKIAERSRQLQMTARGVAGR